MTGLRLDFDPFAPEFCADPYPMLRQLREQQPVHRRAGPPGGPDVWYLTRYADVQRALREDALGRQAPAGTGPACAFDPLAMLRRTVFHLDPPDHTRLRHLIVGAFSARRVAAAQSRIAGVVDGLLDRMSDGHGPVDVIEGLARPLPVVVVAELMGLPVEDVEQFRRWSSEIVDRPDAAGIRRAIAEYNVYISDVITRLRAHPDHTLLSDLVQECGPDGRISRVELISTVFQLLLAGDETSVNLIGNAVVELLRHPGQLERLRAEPALIGPAVEEVMRFNGPVGHGKELSALTDVAFGDEVVPRGDLVVPVLLAANRDPEVFADPDRFDIGRDSNRHLGFGFGRHFCLGAGLARAQARAAVGRLVGRFPRLELAIEPAELAWTPDIFLHGVRRLPVRL